MDFNNLLIFSFLLYKDKYVGQMDNPIKYFSLLITDVFLIFDIIFFLFYDIIKTLHTNNYFKFKSMFQSLIYNLRFDTNSTFKTIFLQNLLQVRQIQSINP